MHRSRVGVVATVVSLALYVSGLQKRALSPVFDAFGDLDASLQLVGIVAIAAIVVATIVLRARRRRAELLRVSAAVSRQLDG